MIEIFEALNDLFTSLSRFLVVGSVVLIVLYYIVFILLVACIVYIAQSISKPRRGNKQRGTETSVSAVNESSRNEIRVEEPQLTAEQISEEIIEEHIRKKKIHVVVASIVLAGIIVGTIVAIIAAISFNKYKLVDIDMAEVGDTVCFGHYGDPNEWIVLDKKDDKLLLLSRKLICCKPYNGETEKSAGGVVTWSECSLRKWLNTEYLMQAFSEEELESIENTLIHTEDNGNYYVEGALGGDDTVDKVFLLSIEEAEKYLTSYQIGKGKFADRKFNDWWLRSPGYTNKEAAYVNYTGYVVSSGKSVSSEQIAVRPALWIDLKTR